MLDPTPAQVHSACLSYRHDYGLMTDEEKAAVRREAMEWFRAWDVNMPKQCIRCGSHAINQTKHGRTAGEYLDLCDVCYWRHKAESDGQWQFKAELYEHELRRLCDVLGDVDVEIVEELLRDA